MQSRRDDKPMVLTVSPTHNDLPRPRLVDPVAIELPPIGLSAPKNAALSRILMEQRKASLGSVSAARKKPLSRPLRCQSLKSTGIDRSDMTAEEKEQLQKAAFDRADLNHDLALEATEIKLVHDSCGMSLTDAEVWGLIMACHKAYDEMQGDEVQPEVDLTQKRSACDKLVVHYEHFLAYPELLPDSFMEQTFKLYLPSEIKKTNLNIPTGRNNPLSKLSKRRGSGFTYVATVAERQPLRHAILIAIDRYRDARIPPTAHCINDVRALGEVLQTVGYSVELLVNDMADGGQPSRSAILDTLTCSRDRGVDMLLVFFVGYWMTAHLQGLGAPANKLTQFCICHDTSLDFTAKTVLTLADIKQAVAGPYNDVSTIIAVDGLQPAFIPGCRGEGMSILSYLGQDMMTPSHLRHRSLFSYYMRKGMGGDAANGDDSVTIGSLHRYLGSKLCKYTYSSLPTIPPQADSQVLSTQLPPLSGPHPRKALQAQQVQFTVECGIPATAPPDDFPARFLETIRKSAALQEVEVVEVEKCKVAEFLLAGSLQDVEAPAMLQRIKTEVEKMADETQWVRMRENGAASTLDSGLRWTLTASYGLDALSPALLLTIATTSAESVGKMRTRFLHRHLKEWAGLPILWMRQRVRVVCASSEYERLKLDIRCRSGTLMKEKEEKEKERIKNGFSSTVYIYNVDPGRETVWKPEALPLRKFTRLSDVQFEKLYEGLPILIHWCGKLEEPNASITSAQSLTHKALRDVCTEVTFKNKMHFFVYETDHVVYPRHVVEGLAKYHSRRAEDEVTIVSLKYDRAATLGLGSASSRISAARVRTFCNDFTEGKATRLHDGTMKALRPPGLPEDHPGCVVVGINHFDRLVMDIEKDVLVLYWNVDCPPHQQEKLERASAAFAKLGKMFSEQPDDVHLPTLIIMSDDNNERFFFPEHHPEAKVHIPAAIAPPDPSTSHTTRSPVAGRRLPLAAATSSDSASPSVPFESPGAKPAFTIRLFPADEAAALRRRRGEFVDYWPEVFASTVQACRTFFAAANGAAPLCAFLEKNTDWAPRVPLRIALEEETKAALALNAKLPDIFQGL